MLKFVSIQRPYLATLLFVWVLGCQPTPDDDDATPISTSTPIETTPSSASVTDPATQPEGTPPATPPQNTEHPSQPEGTEDPSQPEGTEDPSQPEGTDDASQPEGTEDPSQPEGTDDASQPEGTEDPSQPEGTEDPSQPEGTEDPSQPEGTEDPSQPEGTDDPSQPEGTDTPTATLPVVTPTPNEGTDTPVGPTLPPPGDRDGDGCLDNVDAFPTDPNQCLDSDSDGVGDESDNCVNGANYNQNDFDGDELGDVCDNDADGDGYISPNNGGSDCDDLNVSVHPGAKEVCDPHNVDEDCDGKADDADSSVDPYSLLSYYEDIDNDHYGNILDTTATRSCDPPNYLYAPSHDDCDDRVAAVNPGATEVCDARRTDDNCDGVADEAAGLTCIAIDDTNLNFGVSYPPEILTDIVTLYNYSNYTISLGTPTVTGVSASMFAASLPRTTIPVGGSINVVVDYVPTEYGNHTATLTLPNDRFSTYPQVYLQGEGEKALVATPSPLSFPLTEVEKSSTTTLTLTNTSDLVLELEPDGFLVSGAQKTNFFVSYLPPAEPIAPGETTSLDITFAPTQAGVATASLTVSTTAGHTEIVALSGTGFLPNGTAPLLISQFTTRGVGGAADEFIELYNNTDSILDLYGWEIWGSSSSAGKGKRYQFFSGRQIAPRSYLLLAFSSGGGAYTGSVTPDGTYSSGISDEGGIAILNPLKEVVDQVGMSYGSAYLEGTPLPPMLTSIDQSYRRKTAEGSGRPLDSNNNIADFTAITPSAPRNSSSPPTL